MRQGAGVKATEDPAGGGEPRRWYAAHLRSNHERLARDHLVAAGLEAFLPLYRVTSKRWDRRALVDRPLFRGYVFVRSALRGQERVHILRAPGVVRVVGFAKGPSPIPDEVLDAVKRLVGNGADPKPHPYLTEGRRVRVMSGPLAGIEGFLVKADDGKRRIVVSIELLGRSVSAKVDSYELEPTD